MSKNYEIKNEFLGYRNREDQTNLDPRVMVHGSFNVLTNLSDRLSVRKGFTLYGTANTNQFGVIGSYDLLDKPGTIPERHIKAWSSNIDVLYRGYNDTGTPEWVTMYNTATNPNWNFTEYWDTTNQVQAILGVNGGTFVWYWNGAMTGIDTNTANTITKQGTTTWAQEGFSVTGNVVINGVSYAYTGGTGTTTITGLAALPAFAPGTCIVQEATTTNFAAMTGIPGTYTANLIATMNDQVFLGSFANNDVYGSKVGDYTDYTYSADARLAGEGTLLHIDSVPRAFAVQDSALFISFGKNGWVKLTYTQQSIVKNVAGVDFAFVTEYPNIEVIKTTSLQGARSQSGLTIIENNIAFLSFSKRMLILGKTQFQGGDQTSFFNNETMTDLSYPVIYDFNNFKYGDAIIFYHQLYTYCSFPKDGVVMVYNHHKEYWEAPQVLSVGKFAVIDGELYGHGYSVPETYKLFDGYNDNGNAVASKAVFAFDNYGKRAEMKSCLSFYLEGYIRTNTTLYITSKFEQVGCGTSITRTLLGSNGQVVCLNLGYNPIGQWQLGLQPIGNVIPPLLGNQNLPPAFQADLRIAPIDFNKQQFIFESDGIDQAWELVAWGSEVYQSDHQFVHIKI